MGMNERTKPRKQKLFLEGFLKKVALEKVIHREGEQENSRQGDISSYWD